MSDISEDVGTRLLFENDRVRVWDLTLAPGESTGRHRHTADYFYVVIGGGKVSEVEVDTVHLVLGRLIDNPEQ